MGHALRPVGENAIVGKDIEAVVCLFITSSSDRLLAQSDQVLARMGSEVRVEDRPVLPLL
jgi:hypothetical protein